MEKFEIRNQVRSAVKTMFTYSLEKKEVIIYNLELKLDIEDDNLMESSISIKRLLSDDEYPFKWFYIQEYAGNYWDMVTEPWVCDLINDITECVIKNIEEPKEKGW